MNGHLESGRCGHGWGGRGRVVVAMAGLLVAWEAWGQVGGAVGGGASVNGVPIPLVTTVTRDSVQWGGRGSLVNLLANEGVQQELGVSPAQKGQIDTWVAEARQASGVAGAGRLGAENRDSFRQIGARVEVMQQEVPEFEGRVLAVLRPEQRLVLDQACAKDRSDAGRVVGPGRSGAAASASGTADAGIGGGTASGGQGGVQRQAGGGGYTAGGGPGSPLRVMRFPTVRKSLELDAAQEAEVEGILGEFSEREADMRRDIAALRPSRAGRGGVPPAARRAAEVSADVQKRLEAILTPAQMARARELSIQADGPAALFRQEVMEVLKLNPSQQSRLAWVSEDTRKQVDAVFVGSRPQVGPTGVPLGGGRPKLVTQADLDRAERLRKLGAQRLMAVLTSTQREAFERMKGRPFAGINQIAEFGGVSTSEVSEARPATP